jgi:hypothetical protein
LLLDDLGGEQRELALELVRESLSSAGFQTARDVMRLNETIGEITGRPHEYGEWAYWLSLFGTPSDDQPWGWQIDGHHLIVNCLVLGDQVVIAPQFMGSEPVVAESGRHAGTRVFQLEEEHGPSDDDAAFYYRVHSPVVLIEFDHQSGIALDNDAPSRNHIHTVVRTPNGNDYGKDLLRQHYARHHR